MTSFVYTIISINFKVSNRFESESILRPEKPFTQNY